MYRKRYKVLINWSGEILEFYTHSTSPEAALKNALRRCSVKVGYNLVYVKKYVMEPNARRWEVLQ